MQAVEHPPRPLEHHPESLVAIFARVRHTLEKRLEALPHPYHNKQHGEYVMHTTQTLLSHLADPTLLSGKEKIILIECALRHDDGHSGYPHRQDIATDNLSNEEYAVALLRADLQGQVDAATLDVMDKNILATSFGQNNAAKLPAGKEQYYRAYQPETDSQKLLAFADVSGFTKGWDSWVDDSFHLLEESPQNIPPTMDAWIQNGVAFLTYYVSPLLTKIEPLLKPDFVSTLRQTLEDITKKLSLLTDTTNPQRLEYEVRFNTIKQAHY